MDVLTLLLVIAVCCLLCWAVVRLPPPGRTIGLVVLAVLALLVLLSLLGLIPGLRAQEPPVEVSTPQPFDLAPAEEPPAPLPHATIKPSVTEVNGAPVAIVPAPPEASPAEVAAVAAQSAENLEAVASGEVTLAEATRDPTSSAPDPGADVVFWVIAIVVGSIIRPISDIFVDKLAAIDNRLRSPVSLAVVLLTYTGAWSLLHSSNPSLPQSWVSWAIAGLAASGFGSATNAVRRSMSGSQPEPAVTP